MFEQYKRILEGQEFSSIEDYNSAVLRASNSLQEDLGKTERFLLKATPEVLEDLGVEIKED